MIEHYPQLRLLHITSATCGGLLLTLRGAGLLVGQL
jgi:hypothetical protein